jgi:hypothetical protein
VFFELWKNDKTGRINLQQSGAKGKDATKTRCSGPSALWEAYRLGLVLIGKPLQRLPAPWLVTAMPTLQQGIEQILVGAFAIDLKRRLTMELQGLDA